MKYFTLFHWKGMFETSLIFAINGINKSIGFSLIFACAVQKTGKCQ